MFDARTFHVVETLHDGGVVEIRALKPEDRKAILEEISHASADTLYHRFFAVKRSLSPEEEHHLFDIDFVKHIVLVAVARIDGEPRIVGGARIIVVGSAQAEVAFSIVDDYQHHGLGAALMRHIKEVGRALGMQELVAEVLSDNMAMLAVFEHSGLATTTRRDGPTVHVAMRYPDAPIANGRVTGT